MLAQVMSMLHGNKVKLEDFKPVYRLQRQRMPESVMKARINLMAERWRKARERGNADSVRAENPGQHGGA